MADAEGRPTDVHELNRQLADTIGASVEQLLGMSGNSEANNMMIDLALKGNAGSGQPGAGGITTEQPKAAGQPDPTGSAPATGSASGNSATAQEGEIDWESTKAPNGLYLGKYKSKTEAIKGVANTVAMAKVAFSRAEEMAGENTRLKQQVESLRNRPVAAPATAPQGVSVDVSTREITTDSNPKLDAVMSKLQENGNLDAEDLKSLVSAISEHSREEARRAARDEFESRTTAARAEQDRWGKVEEFMAEKYPESVNFTDELALFIKSHPLIGAGVQALIAQDRHEEATAQAWEAFTSQQGMKSGFVPAPATKANVEKEIRLDAADQVRREAVEAARKDAGVIPSIAGGGARGVHENANVGPTQAEFEDAVALMRQGDGAKWRALVFGDALNHPLFNS